jgi:hypothetical protein
MSSITFENGSTVELTEEALSALATKELLAVYNELSETSIASWKSKKATLVAKTLAAANVPGPSAKTPPSEKNEKPVKKTKAKKEKPAKVKKEKPVKEKKPRGPSKSQLVLKGLLEQSKQGKYITLESLTAYAGTSEGSVRSYITYYRNGKKGFPVIGITLERGAGFILEKDGIKTAEKFLAE